MERSVMMIARKEVRTEVLTSFLSDSHQHQQRPAHDEEQADEGFSGERFMKDHIGKTMVTRMRRWRCRRGGSTRSCR